jgi:hypothetical protein
MTSPGADPNVPLGTQPGRMQMVRHLPRPQIDMNSGVATLLDGLGAVVPAELTPQPAT